MFSTRNQERAQYFDLIGRGSYPECHLIGLGLVLTPTAGVPFCVSLLSEPLLGCRYDKVCLVSILLLGKNHVCKFIGCGRNDKFNYVVMQLQVSWR